jgi:O-antigen ligase
MLNLAQPYFYLLVYIVVLYIRPQEYHPVFVGTPIVPALLGFAALFWLVAQKKNFEAPQHRLLPALVVAMFMSVAMTGWMTGALNAVVDFAPTLILYYLVATSVDSIKRFREMALVLTLVCCVLVLHGAEQALSEGGIGWTGAKMIDGRITYLGFLNDPNDLAMAFVMTLPFTLYLAQVSRWFVWRHALHAAAALLLYGIYLCNSRGGLLALAAMLFVYSIRRFGLTRSVVVAPVLGVPLVLLAPSRINEISADEESAAGRVDAWFEGFEMFRSHPVFGIGKDLFTDHNPLTAHNSFVLAIAELGVVGYFFWLAIVVLSGLMLYRLVRADAPQASPPGVSAGADAQAIEWSDWQLAARTVMYSFVGVMVAAFFLSRTYIAILFLLIALVVAVHQSMRSRWPLIAPLTVREQFKTLLKFELGSIVGLWVLTRVLLNLS